MLSRVKNQLKIGTSPSILKCAAIFLLFAFSALIVACGSNSGTAAGQLGGPVVTVTIQLADNQGISPTPTLAPYWCGAWATQTSPAYNSASNVGVYAKFTQNAAGNPEGIGGATATATVLWPDTSTTTQTVMTTSDGLAVFSISTANKAFAINKITLVTVTFEKIGLPMCRVENDQAAFFTLVTGSSTGISTGGAPSATETPIGIPTGIPPTQLPKPKPTKKPRQ